MLDPRQAREAVHVLLLRRLLQVRRGEAVTLKGGVTLRLFYASPRYSEDIDLDGEPDARLALRNAVTSFLEDEKTVHDLKSLGLRGLDPMQGPNKDTSTTFRYKFHVLAPGGLNYPTKVEISYRGSHPDDVTRVATPNSEIIERYLGNQAELEVPHYARPSAIRQKIEALAGRSKVQARDVFDLYLLTNEDPSLEESVEYWAEHLSGDVLNEASRRAFALEYGDYEGQVVEFLDADVQDHYRDESVWEELQLHVGYLIDAIRERQGTSDE